MEEKHIYSSSPWKKLQDKLVLVKQELQETIRALKPKSSKLKLPVTNKEETPKKLESSSPEIISYAKSNTEKPSPKKIKPKFSKKISEESDQKILVFILSTTIVVIIGLGIFLSYKNPQPREKTSDKSPQTQTTPTPGEDEAVNWKTYADEVFGFSFKYPADLVLEKEGAEKSENDKFIKLTSKPILCKTDVTGSTTDVYISEVDIKIRPSEGEKFEDRWENSFNFAFSDSSYDGKMSIGDKEAYYFFQGAEMLTSRQAILVNQSALKTIEINIYKPLLVDKCESPIDKNSEIPNQILSTFKFTDAETLEGKFCGGIANIQCPEGYACKLDGSYPDAGGKCARN
ncbi:hypothetical protein M1307_01390 [Patescibacteria group bacterium]|nr:hypothetical protein [Patescibacteria group bacterium]